MKLLLSYWRAELRLNGYVRCPMYKVIVTLLCHCYTLYGTRLHKINHYPVAVTHCVTIAVTHSMGHGYIKLIITQ